MKLIARPLDFRFIYYNFHTQTTILKKQSYVLGDKG